MRLDHLAIAAETLEEGVAWAEERLGVTFLPGGQHPRYGTHNRLLGLADGLYLEVIAVDPAGQSDGPRWFGLDTFSGPPRLANWICEPDDFDTALRHGMVKVPMARGDLRWDMGVPPDGSLPMGGAYPTVLKWQVETPPGQGLAGSGCSLRMLTITHPEAAAISASLPEGFADPRVRFETGATVGLRAEIETPQGTVTL